MIYLLNFLLVPIYYCVIRILCKTKEQKNQIFMIIFCIHATLFRALANPYNYVDTEGYAIAFQNIASMNLRTVFSPLNPYLEWGVGYVVINRLIGFFTDDPKFLFICVAALTIVPLCWLYAKTTKNDLMTVLLFLSYPMLYLMGFGVLRQHLAVTYVLLALYFVNRAKYSLPFALLAVSFHTSAMIFFPYYIWRKLSFKKKSGKKGLVFVVGGAFCGRLLLSKILSSLSRYSDLLSSNENANNIIPVIVIGGLVLLFLFEKTYKKTNSTDFEIYNFCLYGLAVVIFGIGLPGMGRLALYFLYIIPIAVTLLGAYSAEFKLLNIGYLFMFSLLIYVLITIDSNSIEGFNYNYSFFWEKETLR